MSIPPISNENPISVPLFIFYTSIYVLTRINTYIYLLVFRTIEKGGFVAKVGFEADFRDKKETLETKYD